VRAEWFVPAGFVVVTMVFYAAVAPVVAGAGAVAKGMVTMLPVIVIAALIGLSRARVRGWLSVVVVAVLIGSPLLTLKSTTRNTIQSNNQAGAVAAASSSDLRAEAQCLPRPLIVMTRNPWELTQATGYPSVMIPNNALADVIATAGRYGATDIIWSTQRPGLGLPSALVKQGVLAQPPSLRGTSIYRITATTSGARC
jgi:hypothetical protein